MKPHAANASAVNAAATRTEGVRSRGNSLVFPDEASRSALLSSGTGGASGVRVTARLRHFSVVAVRGFWRSQHQSEHFVDARHEMHAQVALDLGWHVFEIAFVARR